MTDSRPTERFGHPLSGAESTASQGRWYPQPVDPAYADQAPFAPTTYGSYAPQWAAPSLGQTSPTTGLPAYWQQGQAPPGDRPPGGMVPPPPHGPNTPRWLWIAAGTAMLLVVGLVIALIIANGAVKRQTAVPPLPAMPEPSTTMPRPVPPTRTSPSSPVPAPLPPTYGPKSPPETTPPAAMQDIVYNVTGQGRALSIMYIGTGDVIQTEFNVALPWSKEVTLAKTATHPPNVTVVNFGNDVTCSVTIGGMQVSRRVGIGLTICDARGG